MKPKRFPYGVTISPKDGCQEDEIFVRGQAKDTEEEQQKKWETEGERWKNARKDVVESGVQIKMSKN